MPEDVAGWEKGTEVRVVRQLDPATFRTIDSQPPVGAIGTIMYANTCNGVPESIAVMFPDRSWVYPIGYLSTDTVTDDELRAAIDSIIGGES